MSTRFKDGASILDLCSIASTCYISFKFANFIAFFQFKCCAWFIFLCLDVCTKMQYSRGGDKDQGSRPRPRPQKNSEAKDSPSEDRCSRGQGQECSRPRPRTEDTTRKQSQKKKNLCSKNS